MEPWRVCPELTAERIQLLARDMVSVRATLALSYQPELGDDPWCFGCQAYSRTCYAIEQRALSGKYPWLRVDRLGLKCKVFIGGEAVTFFHGDAENPSSRSLHRGFDGLLGNTAFEFFEKELEADPGVWFWLIAIETNEDGTVSRVVILQANANGDVRNLWDVPMEEPPARIAPVIPITRQPVDLPPPPVGPKGVDQDHAASHGEGDDGEDS